MIRVLRAIAIATLIVGLPIGGYVAIEYYQRQARVPSGKTLASLSKSEIPLVEFLYVNDGSAPFYLWVSELLPFGVPSGPGAYAFDTKGNLLDWGAETGEGYSIDRYYDKRYRGVPLSLEDALTAVEESAQGNLSK